MTVNIFDRCGVRVRVRIRDSGLDEVCDPAVIDREGRQSVRRSELPSEGLVDGPFFNNVVNTLL